MIEITAEIRALIDKAAAGVELAGDEYIDPSDGLIHCKKCGGQRQTVVPCFGKSGYFMPRCICQCQREAEEQRKAAEERQRRMERIKRRKAQGLQDRYLYDYTFANDNGKNPLMDKARAYVENWKEAYKNNTGLLLFGDVGTGKSFFAGCIANALLDRDVPVLMTNFPTILNRLTGMFSEDRADFIASFDEYDLLIIDDLGVERSTEYAMEQMFFVIDSRYRSRRPMIITTNLKLSELKNPPDLAHARIYDRILERCAPILFAGKNFRANVQMDAYPITAINRLIPDFNVEVLPKYNLAAWRGLVKAEQGGAVAAMFGKYYITSKTQIQYQCATANCAYFRLTDGSRYVAYSNGDYWTAAPVSSDIAARNYFMERTGGDYSFIILDD